MYHVVISKPKKSDNSYLCSLYYKTKSQKPSINIPSAILVGTKPLPQRNEFFLYIKSKTCNDFFYDLNNHIIDVVKEKCAAWFNNNINPDLIEDLYTNTLIYDRKYGDVIKLKCVGNQEHFLNSLVDQKVDVTVVLNHLRFYKQKFVMECDITSCEPKGCTIVGEEDDHNMHTSIFEDELPSPTYEDIARIKQEYAGNIDVCLMKLQSDVRSIQQKITCVETLRNELLNTSNVEKIARVYTEFEKVRD